MKNIKYFSILFLAALFCSCNNDMEEVKLPASPTEADIVINKNTTDTLNVLNFESTVPMTAQYVWDLGNGQKMTGQKVKGSFPFKGTYEGTLTVITKGGMAFKPFTTVITEDNYELVSDSLYAKLTGGIDATDGRTWIIDAATGGHMGVGPDFNPDKTICYDPQWWNAQPNEKVGLGIYDDEVTFVLKGAKFIIKNNGTTFVNAGAKDLMIGRGGTVVQDVGDLVMNYTPGTNWSWSIEKEGDRNFIVFPDGQGFMMYFTAGPYKYEILSIDDNSMNLRIQLSGLAWYLKLIRKAA